MVGGACSCLAPQPSSPAGRPVSGAATARRLAQAGARVAVVDLDGDRAHSLAGELERGALAFKADVTSESEVEAAVSATVEALGGLRFAVVRDTPLLAALPEENRRALGESVPSPPGSAGPTSIRSLPATSPRTAC